MTKSLDDLLANFYRIAYFSTGDTDHIGCFDKHSMICGAMKVTTTFQQSITIANFSNLLIK